MFSSSRRHPSHRLSAVWLLPPFLSPSKYPPFSSIKQFIIRIYIQNQFRNDEIIILTLYLSNCFKYSLNEFVNCVLISIPSLCSIHVKRTFVNVSGLNENVSHRNIGFGFWDSGYFSLQINQINNNVLQLAIFHFLSCFF